MPDRKRFAVVVMPLLALLAALLLGWSVAAAQAPDPLTLTLTAERSECTAGTLNPVRWTISGGTAPYTLTVAGETVDPTAESVNVTCGALPEGASAAPGTITATVRDSAGRTATASAAYTIVPPLPAPTEVRYYAQRTHIWLGWDRVAEAGPVPPRRDCPCPLYLLRWRPSGTTTWVDVVVTDRSSPGQTTAQYSLDELREGTTYELAVAALRDVIEQQTPAALTWSTTITAATVAPPTGVRATATHDTITVTWDAQAGATRHTIGVTGPHGATSQRFTPDGRTPHQVVFRHLPPNTEYTVDVSVWAADQTPVTEITVSTTAAPSGWTPLARGPQNLRTSVTHDSVAVAWDAPYAGANDVYGVWLFHAGKKVGSTVASGGVTAHTFSGLEPFTPYEVEVLHADIVYETVSASVRTASAPAQQQRVDPVTGCVEPLVGVVNCPPPPPLALTLTAGRAQCTAGTRNPVTWTITGGTTPYTLTVAGQSVDATAESVNVTCAALPEGATDAPGTIWASVRDSAGRTAMARAAYTIVPPLPAPTGVGAQAFRTAFQAVWDRVPAAGPLPTHSADCPCPLYLLRWRPAGTDTWASELYSDRGSASQPGTAYYVNGVREGTLYQLSIATLRDAIEQETPVVLAWSAPVTVTTVAPATGVKATATHDTITVTWDPQPGVAAFGVRVRWLRGSSSEGFTPDGDAPHQVVFRHLPPSTEYRVQIFVDAADQTPVTEITVSTTAPPADWTPLPRGPQNLRTTVTHNSVTLDWDAPYAGADDTYYVRLHLTGYGRTRHASVSGGATSHTFVDLTPATRYVVEVRHNDVITRRVQRTVVTLPRPSVQSTRPALTCVEYLVGAMICA
jgi:hypothetical protein